MDLISPQRPAHSISILIGAPADPVPDATSAAKASTAAGALIREGHTVLQETAGMKQSKLAAAGRARPEIMASPTSLLAAQSAYGKAAATAQAEGKTVQKASATVAI